MKILSLFVICTLLLVCLSPAFTSFAVEVPSQEGGLHREAASFGGSGGFVILVSSVAMLSAVLLALREDKGKTKRR